LQDEVTLFMTPYSANPFAYIFSVVAIAGAILYFGYSAIDRTGLQVTTVEATVAGKQFTESGKSYYTTMAGGRAWIQSQETPETYAVTLNVGNERTAGVVSKQLYELLKVNERVRVSIQRTRITGRLEVVEISR
jgi:hypothetical protein